MESAGKFIEKQMRDNLMQGVLKDLKDNLEGLKEDISDARDLLDSLETEEVLLKLIIDYTEMLQGGLQGTEDKVLKVVRQACAINDTLNRAKDVKVKVEEFKENTKKLVEQRRAEMGSTSPNADLNWEHRNDPLPTIRTANQLPSIEAANKMLFKWADQNDGAAITEFCNAKMFKYEDLDYYTAWERAVDIGNEEAQEVLEHYFGELIENRQFEEVIPKGELIIANKFRESQISLAAMSAARIWGKTPEDRGKFSLRVFIDCLEQIVGPEVELDTDSVEQALKECSSVAHVSGDIWTEVN